MIARPNPARKAGLAGRGPGHGLQEGKEPCKLHLHLRSLSPSNILRSWSWRSGS